MSAPGPHSRTSDPRGAMDNLFKPFKRGEGNQQRLGLGLFIASEIARIHGGTLTVTSTLERTSFVFRMPLGVSKNAVGAGRFTN